MHKKRLLDLADTLEQRARSKAKGPRFALAEWGHQRQDRRGKTPNRLSCATAACAVGTAMLMPKFRKQGLKCIVRDGTNRMEPVFQEHENWPAVDAFFDLSRPGKRLNDASSSAVFLFSEDEYPITQRSGKRAMLAVAKRIRAFVAGEAQP